MNKLHILAKVRKKVESNGAVGVTLTDINRLGFIDGALFLRFELCL